MQTGALLGPVLNIATGGRGLGRLAGVLVVAVGCHAGRVVVGALAGLLGHGGSVAGRGLLLLGLRVGALGLIESSPSPDASREEGWISDPDCGRTWEPLRLRLLLLGEVEMGMLNVLLKVGGRWKKKKRRKGVEG